MFVAWEIGKRMGQHEKGHTRSSKFDAFTFGMSIERHDRRRLMVVADSNAIGDFYTCAALLNEPTRTKLQAVIQQYAQLRLALARGSVSIESALDTSDQMHRQMTELVGQALREGTPIAVSLTNTLNAVSSNQASRLSAF